MPKHFPLLIVLFILLAGVGAAQEDGWTTIQMGQTVYGIRYDQPGAVVVNNSFVMSCGVDPQSGLEAGLYISQPSPLKKFVLVLCSRYAEDEAYVIDTAQNRVVSRDVVPKHWSVVKWVSWSPDERFALLAAAGEITMGDMAFVNVTSGTSQDIHFKNFTNTRGIDPAKTPYDRLQDFDPDKLRWISPTSFRFDMDVRCNPYERGESCNDKVISSHSVRVNLTPLSISYLNAGPRNPKRTSAASQIRAPQVPKSTPVSKQELIQQIISDDDTVTSSCVEKLGDAENAVEVESIDLNRDGKTDYLVSGLTASINIDMTGNGKSEIVDCLCGSRRCHNWLYVDTGNGYLLVLSAKDGGILPLKTYTNGYRDLSVESVSGNSRPVRSIYKFDGIKYQEIKQRAVRRPNKFVGAVR